MKGSIFKWIILITIMISLAGHFPGFIAVDGSTITGRTSINSGLPTSGTYTIIEVGDTDDDGADEMFIGGVGWQSTKTQGIASYEYDTQTSSWSSFASGLPGTSSGKYYGKVSIGDIDEDGNLDLVAGIHDRWSGSSSNGIEIYTGNGAGSFSLAHTIDIGTGSGASVNEVAVEDLDGDNDLDIVVAENSGVRVFFGSGSTSSWTEKSPTLSNNEVDGVAVGDLNNDGLLDVICTYYTNSESDVYILGSSRTWSNPGSVKSGTAAFGIRIADLDADGNNDVVYGTRSKGIRACTGNGGGSTGGTSFTWTSVTTGLPTSGGDWFQTELADINGDDRPDIISATETDNRAHVYLNNLSTGWDEIFTGSDDLSMSSDVYAAAFGDWDGDGDLDVAAGSWGSGLEAWTINRNVVPPPPENRKPMPDAGADMDIYHGQTARLDGTNSSDPDDAPTGDIEGNVLKYEWNFTRVPPSSSIDDSDLSPNDTVAKPSFVPDMPGIYDLSLAVFDGEDWSNESDQDDISINVIKPNDLPRAICGQDLSGYVGDEFTLDGSGSFDPDGEIIEYDWECLSHTLSLSNENSTSPSFVAEQAGRYEFTLRVRDDNGTWSGTCDSTNVTAVERGENLPPVASAGPDMRALRGEEVVLDGSGSEDPDGSILSFEWTCTSHTVTFSGSNSSSPSFTPQEAGPHVIELRVEDINHTWSSPDTVTVAVEDPYVNLIPTADAGEDISLFTGDTVVLDGSSSNDPNGNLVNYNWTCISHDVDLMDPNGPTPSFVPQETGTYVFTLSVSDNDSIWSPEDEVSVFVTQPPMVHFNISVGPFRYDDGEPISQGKAELSGMDDNTISSQLSTDGIAVFTGITQGEYTLELIINGSTILDPLLITVTEEGSINYDQWPIPTVEKDQDVDEGDDKDEGSTDEENDLSPEEEESGTPLLWIFILVISVVIVGSTVGYLILRSREDENERGDEETEKIPEKCPDCNGAMEFSEDFNKYRCTDCGRYI